MEIFPALKLSNKMMESYSLGILRIKQRGNQVFRRETMRILAICKAIVTFTPRITIHKKLGVANLQIITLEVTTSVKRQVTMGAAVSWGSKVTVTLLPLLSTKLGKMMSPTSFRRLGMYH